MHRFALILLVLAVAPAAIAQNDIYDSVDEMPSIEGGMDALLEVLTYPEEAQEDGLEGRVVVSFVVDGTGHVRDAEVVESAHALLDAAALEAVESLAFTPGMENGTAVSVRMALPVTFELPK